MACKTSFELYHHFPKLAEESGFTFNTHRPRIHIDWNKIRLIDIDSVIKERKFVIIEQHLNNILDCVLESEFDVRILDEGFMKMFRLAQLAVEYQQFCRHYLDRSVYVLREEITSLTKELDICKKDIREKDDEIRRLRKRSRHSYKTPLAYGNDNIAAMILKTLSQQKSDLFSNTSNDIIQYNKCNYCDKVFLNQLYLKSHMSRRHADITETPQRDKQENNENAKLVAEVNELKHKLKDMEIIIANTNSLNIPNNTTTSEHKESTGQCNKIIEVIKVNTRDAEVSTNNEEFLINKIEEWKKAEHENYNKEMDKLRNQVMDTINSIKDNNDKKETNNISPTEPNLMLQLHDTIKQQGAEILALRKELSDSKIRTEREATEKNKESENQITFWSKRAEAQSKQYEIVLQKLNEVARNANESRDLAEAEKERAAQLQLLLQKSLNTKADINVAADVSKFNTKPIYKTKTTSMKKKSKTKRSEQEADHKTLETLHRKAQELLNIDLTSTSSESSSKDALPLPTKSVDIIDRYGVNNKKEIMTASKVVEKKNYESKLIVNSNNTKKSSKATQIKPKKEKKSTDIKLNHVPGSPLKVLRAKITEEVNNRLVSAGVDPLKSRLPQGIFQKQRMQLRHHVEMKSKENPAHEKTRHKILAYLDSNTSLNKEVISIDDYTSPTKVSKSLKNLSSVISNVKTKALSLVKLNDTTSKQKQRSQHADVAKRAMSLLKTPPGSTTSSPISAKRSPFKALNENIKPRKSSFASKTNQEKKETIAKLSSPKSNKISDATLPVESYSEDGSEQSDHKYYKTNSTPQSSKSIESLVKSPARRPASATADYNYTVKQLTSSDDNLLRTQSATNLTDYGPTGNGKYTNNEQSSSENTKSLSHDIPVKRNFLEDNNIHSSNKMKKTKSVLKNASSTSSLNKKKVLFDMDAIQMKSVSASPSQSLTEKSDGNEKFELGLVNLDGEEWDISSIENEPLTNDTKIQNILARTSPKIAELKEKIESQLARRIDTSTAPLVGGVDVLAGSMVKPASIGGSNTSLGSSILDESESIPVVNHKTLVKPKKEAVKNDSDIDISEFSIDGLVNKSYKNESF